MITKKVMMSCVYNQLAIDYNCSPDDFLKDGLIFTEAKELNGRRFYPWRTPRLELVTFGNSVVINASKDILPYVKKQMEGKSRDEVFYMPFIYGIGPYFLPDLDHLVQLDCPSEFEYEMIEREKVQELYIHDGFGYALKYDINDKISEDLVVVGRYKGEIAGIASGSIDSKNLRMIGVDVLPSFRGKRLASALVNMLTLEILNRGLIPYYSTSGSNMLSQRVAINSGYVPVWAHCYKTRLENIIK